MYLDDVKYKSRTKTWVRIIFLLLAAGYIATFWKELRALVRFTWGIINFFLGKPFILPENTLGSIVILTFNLFIFLIAFFIMAYIVASQALVPVSTQLEKRRTTWHLIMHMLRMHGPAVFVQSGKIIESEEDIMNTGPGLMAIDYNSAVVLEEQFPRPNIAIEDLSITQRIMYDLGTFQPYHSPRAVGAGITFTRAQERIRGVVDLRTQSRVRQNVRGYTRDGIEITTNVYTLFTLGQEPDVLEISYDGPRSPDNLRVLDLKKIIREDGSFQVEVRGFNNELCEIDREEIHEFAEDALHNQVMNPYENLIFENIIPRFDAERVFAAIFSEARGEQEKVVPWFDLPPIVAVDMFRELLSQYNYDQLYQPLTEADFPTFKLRQHFRTRVRNTGAISCRLVFHKSRRPLTQGIYDANDLRISSVYSLTNPKILRERGIKLITCGFTDLVPPDEIYLQRLDNWRATWEKDTKIAQAAYELESLRVQNKARLQAQQELRFEFMKILEASNYPKEVLALRVVQALENAATDPKTKQLLPKETLDLMKNLSLMIKD